MFISPDDYARQLKNRIDSLEAELDQLRSVYTALVKTLNTTKSDTREPADTKDNSLSKIHKERIRQTMLKYNAEKRQKLIAQLKELLESEQGYSIDELMDLTKAKKNTLLKALHSDPFFVHKDNKWYSFL